jgi:hypothetical protein
VAAEHDDNVPLRASNSEETGPTESWLLKYSLYGELRFADQKIDTWPFTLGFGYSLSGSEVEHRAFDDYALLSQSLRLFLSRSGDLFGNFYDLRLGGHASDTELGGESYSKVSGASLSMQYNWLNMIASTLLSSWDSKDYVSDSAFPQYYSLDGNEYNIGLYNSFYFLENRLILGLNYNYRVMDAEGSQAELQSNDLSASLTVNLPLEIRFLGQAWYQQEDYPEYYPADRLDDIWTFYASLQRPLVWEQLFLEIGYTHATADSDHDYATYEKDVYSTALSLSF